LEQGEEFVDLNSHRFLRTWEGKATEKWKAEIKKKEGGKIDVQNA